MPLFEEFNFVLATGNFVVTNDHTLIRLTHKAHAKPSSFDKVVTMSPEEAEAIAEAIKTVALLAKQLRKE